jgi:hypothetical protein
MNPKDLKRWVKRQDIAKVAVASDASAIPVTGWGI